MSQIRVSLSIPLSTAPFRTLVAIFFALVCCGAHAQQPELSIQTGHSEPILAMAFTMSRHLAHSELGSATLPEPCRGGWGLLVSRRGWQTASRLW